MKFNLALLAIFLTITSGKMIDMTDGGTFDTATELHYRLLNDNYPINPRLVKYAYDGNYFIYGYVRDGIYYGDYRIERGDGDAIDTGALQTDYFHDWMAVVEEFEPHSILT